MENYISGKWWQYIAREACFYFHRNEEGYGYYGDTDDEPSSALSHAAIDDFWEERKYKS